MTEQPSEHVPRHYIAHREEPPPPQEAGVAGEGGFWMDLLELYFLCLTLYCVFHIENYFVHKFEGASAVVDIVKKVLMCFTYFVYGNEHGTHFKA